MSGAGVDAQVESKNRTLRALKAVKEYAAFVANASSALPINELAKKAAQTVKESAFPREESGALLDALLAVVDVATDSKQASRSAVDAATNAKRQAAQDAKKDAETSDSDAKEATIKRRNAFRVFLFCAVSFAGALYFHEGGVALAAFACCVAVLYPELRAFVLGLRETSP